MARRKPHKHPRGGVLCKLRGPDLSHWPDPPMVPTVILRQCEQAETIEEVRAIVQRFLQKGSK